MRKVYEVSSSNAKKAEELLKKDDLVSRQSIYTRTADSLGLPKKNNYIIVEGSEEALKKADELLKGLAEKAQNQEEILQKFDEIENAAAAGFGALGI